MSELTDFNGTYTTHYELAKPSGEDKVSIDVLNDNMDKLDGILYDIYSRLGPTPQPVIDLPVECPVSEMVQNPWDSATISYVNNTQQLNLSTEKSYICTLVGKDGTNYVGDTQYTPVERTIEYGDITVNYQELGGFTSGGFTPSAPILIDSIWINNGYSFDESGNPVLGGFLVDVSNSNSQGESQTDIVREYIDKIIISEYTE